MDFARAARYQTPTANSIGPEFPHGPSTGLSIESHLRRSWAPLSNCRRKRVLKTTSAGARDLIGRCPKRSLSVGSPKTELARLGALDTRTIGDAASAAMVTLAEAYGRSTSSPWAIDRTPGPAPTAHAPFPTRTRRQK